jgi:hypothetical protein
MNKNLSVIVMGMGIVGCQQSSGKNDTEQVKEPQNVPSLPHQLGQAPDDFVVTRTSDPIDGIYSEAEKTSNVNGYLVRACHKEHRTDPQCDLSGRVVLIPTKSDAHSAVFVKSVSIPGYVRRGLVSRPAARTDVQIMEARFSAVWNTWVSFQQEGNTIYDNAVIIGIPVWKAGSTWSTSPSRLYRFRVDGDDRPLDVTIDYQSDGFRTLLKSCEDETGLPVYHAPKPWHEPSDDEVMTAIRARAER